MSAKLSIRSFTFTSYSHVHDYHQLVIALSGGAENFTDKGEGRIGPGQCIVFPAGCGHRFIPDEDSRFLVADLDELPTSLQNLSHPVVTVPSPLLAFCSFVEEQLEQRLNLLLEQSIGELFEQLLQDLDFLPKIDPRIARVLECFKSDLTASSALTELASMAALSLSQFKNLFKQETGKTPGQYLRMLRMEKAKALLAHTDYPVSIVAGMAGYNDVSSFSHRFSIYFGHSPQSSRKQ